MPTVAIIQARMGSTRLPGKVLKPIMGKPMLWHIVKRVKSASGIDKVVVATSNRDTDKPVRDLCSHEGILCFEGSEDDVLDRFYQAALSFDADPVIRITGDCPFADSQVITDLIRMYKTGYYDHVGVATGAGALYLDKGRFPDGLDAECFSFASLEYAWKDAFHRSDREHVTPYIWRNKELFRCGSLMSDVDYSNLRWTVDNQADFDLINKVYVALYNEKQPFVMADIIRFINCNYDIVKMNSNFIGKEEYEKVWHPDFKKE
jgi:spore coat polysaccharide biosynthesis protein SpsF